MEELLDNILELTFVHLLASYPPFGWDQRIEWMDGWMAHPQRPGDLLDQQAPSDHQLMIMISGNDTPPTLE